MLTEDPVRDGLNWYTYCGNNPIRYIDPSGNSFKDTLQGIVEVLDDNITDGTAKWLIYTITGYRVNYNYESEYDYYLGRVIGDALSVATGAGATIFGVGEIIGSITIGGGVTIGSAGTLAIGGVSISVAGVTAGAAEVVIGGTIVKASVGNFGNDLNGIDRIKNNSYYRSGTPGGGDPMKDTLIREDYENVKSQEFKDFLKANGENPNRWQKVCETWAKSDGSFYERHYWSNINGTKFYFHN
jgi:hypothetical protein